MVGRIGTFQWDEGKERINLVKHEVSFRHC
jgi:uncharacterized DUF497 family protein